MKEYRKRLEPIDSDSSYTYVEMGPKPDMPPWHEQAHPSRFPFPNNDAALRFARTHAEPGREVVIAYPDGRRWDGQKWVA
ncbi:hypothetical protein KI248_gp31 [Mycobacterium phage Phaded]|uniref:Uncharacterized protein n=1 Tax=Mycobacterium phage Phaded TaxID=2686088 RepID=A0A6B9J7Q2_9CAUD|nr:hypothetical protein KI248_gp31 [Mycobacterium phage Phaded]APC43218.1 hypothetical protein SEA_JAAN_71 [Mycobacterium phage Jaan]QGZ16868.1 hypothetical protein SEA_PHADED_68 [Mycobacterium phage Phaded]